MIWMGSWMSDDADDSDMSLGPVMKAGFGILIEGLAWAYFARLIGLYFLGPLILLVS